MGNLICNKISRILKYLSFLVYTFDTIKKSFAKNLFILSLKLHLYLIILSNLKKFKKIKIIFVNDKAFGHSVHDSSLVFQALKNEVLILSVGDKKERNKYLKFYFLPYCMIDFKIPSFYKNYKKLSLRKIVGGLLILELNKNILIKFIGHQKIKIANRKEIIYESTILNLKDQLNLKLLEARDLIYQLENKYIESGIQYHSAAVAINLGLYTNNIFNESKKMQKADKKFQHNLLQKNINKMSESLKVCTLIIRNENHFKPWAGQGPLTYRASINHLLNLNYLINIVGDIESNLEFLKTDSVFKNTFVYLDFRIDEKLHQILAIKNSQFCFGDQSGAQSLSHFFNKKTLIINQIPIGNLSSNTTILPRLWKNNDGNLAPLDVHFNDLFYREKASEISNGEFYFPHVHTEHDILKSVVQFAEELEFGKKNSCIVDWSSFQGGNVAKKYAKHSSISPIFFDFFTR
jgi:hypothetical protein